MNHEFAGNVTMIAELKIKPGMLNDFLDYTVPNLEVSRGFPGNIQFDILVDAACPETVLFYEIWETTDAQQAYMAWRIKAGDLTILLSYLTGMPKFMAFNRIIAHP